MFAWDIQCNPSRCRNRLKKNGDDSDDHYVSDNCYLEKQNVKSSLGAYLRLSEAPYLIFEWHTGYNEV